MLQRQLAGETCLSRQPSDTGRICLCGRGGGRRSLGVDCHSYHFRAGNRWAFQADGRDVLRMLRPHHPLQQFMSKLQLGQAASFTSRKLSGSKKLQGVVSSTVQCRYHAEMALPERRSIHGLGQRQWLVKCMTPLPTLATSQQGAGTVYCFSYAGERIQCSFGCHKVLWDVDFPRASGPESRMGSPFAHIVTLWVGVRPKRFRDRRPASFFLGSCTYTLQLCHTGKLLVPLYFY